MRLLSGRRFFYELDKSVKYIYVRSVDAELQLLLF